MNKALENCVKSILDNKGVTALYIYGSYVNGYYKKDSDIDLVALTYTNSKDKPISIPPNISVHYVQPQALHFFKTGRAYAHLKMVPIYNEEECNNISNAIKSELVRRQLIKFKKKGIVEFGVFDPLKNFLLNYGVERPWRIKPIKRIFASTEARQILGEEYERVFGILEEKGMIESIGEKYRINPNFIFDERTSEIKVKEGFAFKLRNSYCGWHYLFNLPAMISFAMRKV